MYDYLNQSDSSERMEMNTPLNHLPEGCRSAKAIRDVCFRIAHVTRDHFGNYNERRGWLVMDVVCDDPSRICIRYDDANVFIDVPATEVAIVSCRERTSNNPVSDVNNPRLKAEA